MLEGLDKGRSSAMNRFQLENGKLAAVYAVCVQFWIVATFGLALLAVIALILGHHHSVFKAASWALWLMFAASSGMTLFRLGNVRSAKRRYSARESEGK